MLRSLCAFLVLGMSAVSVTALAADEEVTDAPASDNPQTAQVGTTPASVIAAEAAPTPVAPLPTTEAASKGSLEDWRMEVHGYFRAPMAVGISSRPNPDQMSQKDVNGNPIPDGPAHMQLSYGPNRTIDWSYYSFAYTRLQEQDWVEVTFHAKKKHVDAAVGWMGYWLAATGFRNPDAAAVPGIAYLTLDTDFDLAGIKPNIALQMGAWWPGFGYFEKYDTFTLGRFRQMGEQLKLTLPLNSDLTVTLVQGFGTGRDGSFNYVGAASSPLYASKVGLDLIAYGNAQVTYKKLLDIGLHYNYEWTRDPRLTAEASPAEGKAYTNASKAHLSVVGAEFKLRAPYVGRFWISPSFISVKNGWALGGGGGTEVMHSQNGLGIATNYLGWTGSFEHSTGSGSMINVGFLYENALSNVLPGLGGPDVKVSLFGLFTKASLDLPTLPGDRLVQITQDKITQLKYGADVTVQVQDWLAAMVRFDTVIYNLNPDIRVKEIVAGRNAVEPDLNLTPEGFKGSNEYKNLLSGYIFSAITARLSLYSHYLSGECIYLQFSRYFYGDKMVLAGTWPWNTPLVAGSDVIQAFGYSKKPPDENVVKLQAQVKF
jgi:hypothetical protein